MTDELHPNYRRPDALPVELRDADVSDDAQRWISAALRRPIVRAVRLPGASSTTVHRVEFEGRDPVVVKRYLWPGFLTDEPIAPRREVAALRYAVQGGLDVPEVLATDLDGAGVGDGVPTIVMSLLAGRAERSPDLHRLAAAAAAVHAVPAAEFEFEWFGWYADVERRPPPQATQPELWERAIDVWLHDQPAFDPAFIHRDFHPGNVLWTHGRVTGIVDWANGCRGPRGCDIAHCRDNLLRLSGDDAANEFTAAYEATTGIAHHPYWEVTSVLEHDLGTLDAREIAQSEARLGAALAQL